MSSVEYFNLKGEKWKVGRVSMKQVETFFNKKNKTLNKIMESDIYVTWQNLRKPNYHLRIHE